MGSRMKPAEGAMTLAEMKEFAGFSAATQRYVRRSLDLGLEREDAMVRSPFGSARIDGIYSNRP